MSGFKAAATVDSYATVARVEGFFKIGNHCWQLGGGEGSVWEQLAQRRHERPVSVAMEHVWCVCVCVATVPCCVCVEKNCGTGM